MRWSGLWGVLAAVMAGSALAAESPSARDARALAAKIDSKLAGRWEAEAIKPAARADDGEFLRRLSLDLVGKIPLASEARDFLDDPNPGKRAALVDRLIDSPGYAARASMLWRQLLLPSLEDGAQASAGDLEAWLRRKVDEGAGYDRIVRDVLTARLASRDGGAMAVRSGPSPAAFFSAKGGKPETLATDSARAFLGLRLGCAECHNHPFAKWKREEFWGFAAFFAEVPRRTDDDMLVIARREEKDLHTLMIPGTSKVVRAAHLDHASPDWRPRADAREVLADWVVAPENPYFARAAVNRTWARFFGLGLIEPVDDLDAEDEFGMGGLLDDLAGEFRAHGHDLKFLVRAITATRAYNLTSAVGPDGSTAPPLFARMPVRGLSPPQFLDSLAQATGCDPSEARSRLSETFADRDERPTEAQTTILQALTLMNGGFLAGVTSPEAGDVLGAVAGAPYLDKASRVESLYLAALTRRPRPDELALIARFVDRRETEADRARALADVFWAILNGPEFRSNH